MLIGYAKSECVWRQPDCLLMSAVEFGEQRQMYLAITYPPFPMVMFSYCISSSQQCRHFSPNKEEGSPTLRNICKSYKSTSSATYQNICMLPVHFIFFQLLYLTAGIVWEELEIIGRWKLLGVRDPVCNWPFCPPYKTALQNTDLYFPISGLLHVIIL